MLVCVVSCAGCGQIPHAGTESPLSGSRVDQETVLATGNQPEPVAEDVTEAIKVLANPEAPEPEVRAAAAALLDNPAPDWSGLLGVLDDEGVRARLVAAASQDPARAIRLLERTTPQTLDPASRLVLIESVSHKRSRKVVATLIRELRFDATQSASFDALCLLTGRADLGANQSVWQAWATGASELSDQQWRDDLLDQVVVRVQDLESRLQHARRALSDAFRRLYLVTPAPDRAALLAELLGSDEPGLRTLGFELSDRELAANAKLDPVVAAAAIALLENSDPEVRASAARLVNRLAPPEAAEVVTRALVAETDAAAAEPLLQAASRWPSATLVKPVLRWLGNPATLDAACQAGVSLYDAGLLVSDDARERVRALLSPIPEDTRAARLILLAKVGTQADLDEIAALLALPADRIRLAAADALARTDAGVPVLVDAAVEHPEVAPDAIVVLARHDRLDDTTDQIAGLDTWKQAFERASATQVRSAIASRILARFAEDLSPEEKAAFEAAAGPGG